MKTKDFKRELQELSDSSAGTNRIERLNAKLDELQKSLFLLRLGKRTSPQRDISQFKKLRRNIARIQTLKSR